MIRNSALKPFSAVQPDVSDADNAPGRRLSVDAVVSNQKVWVEDSSQGFVLGRIVDLGAKEATVLPSDPMLKPVSSPYDRVFPAEDDDAKDVNDNCALMYLNEATLLHNVRLRYSRDQIYTYVANILIAVNPYADIRNLYSTETIDRYRGKSLGVLPPHVFAIADKAFRDMKVLSQSQSIIVSGESGAGKTESTKYILRYLCETGGHTGGPIEGRILDANPVLEAFGNAKTTRNNNSSRFGKFIEIHFSNKHTVVGGYISHYLLEKSRICGQSHNERNYHIFYQLCAGASDELRQKLSLGKPEEYHYLRQGCTRFFSRTAKPPLSEVISNVRRGTKEKVDTGLMYDSLLDDAKDFSKIDKSLQTLNIGEKERNDIYSTVAAVLHLGNVNFEDDPDDSHGGCRVVSGTETALTCAADLMGVDPAELRQALLFRAMQAAKRGDDGGDVIMVPLKTREAANARDALAKATYSKLFDHIVERINESIPFQSSASYIGVLDIAGFEYFPTNGFEQFCINYCNEKLQTFFNERVLRDEQILYAQEGLNVPRISYADNRDCINLIETKAAGIIDLLNEEGKLPKPEACHFTAAVHRNHERHFRLDLPRRSKLKQHRELRDDEGFVIRHFAGAVCYQTGQFIEKNNDALHASLEALISDSKNPFLKSLFESSAANVGKRSGKLSYVSVASKFRGQLEELMEKLNSTGTSFIRCIKPNVRMVAREFDGGAILSQLQCAGMGSVLELMQQGYPSRTGFQSLYDKYKQFLPSRLARLDARLFCKALFKALGLDDHDFKFGLTKVFFRAGKFAEFDQMMRSDPENLAQLVEKVRRWLTRSRWKRAQWGALMVVKLKNKILYRRENLVKMQKTVKMHQARKRHRPRYQGIGRLKKLKINLSHMQRVTSQLKKEKEESEQIVAQLDAELNAAVHKIRTRETMSRQEIEDEHLKLVTKVNTELRALEKKLEQQKIAEEQENLRRIQAQMEADKRKREEEESRRREEEELRKKKAEMEARRKREEEEERGRLAAEEAAEKSAHEQRVVREQEARRETMPRPAGTAGATATGKLPEMSVEEAMARAIEEDSLARQQLEQERRDRELALRLAREMGVQVDESGNVHQQVVSPGPSSPVHVGARGAGAGNGKKFDLTKWKYSDLRDAINTSCDVELLEACREEFHRRLKVYHAWKAKNRRRNAGGEPERMPQTVLDSARHGGTAARNGAARAGEEEDDDGHDETQQRFFRIPFVRPVGEAARAELAAVTGGRRGWWYAHFDGQYVARQMELHDQRAPVLFMAGKDDVHMCELTLDETGLTRKRGAEILEEEFEREWIRHGGPAYVRPRRRR